MTHRERRSVSLGRHRDRGSRDQSKPIEEDLSTRHNISNFLLTLQRIQASEAENRLLRKENDLLRQRARSYRMSSASSSDQTTILPDAGDEIIAADVKRNSLIFVGESSPTSPEHAALEAQYNKLQEDFKMVKDFLKHLFQHALAIPSSDGYENSYKDGTDKENADINTYNPGKSKQLERSLEDIHGQISQLRNSQEHQQVKMEQVQQALDNVLCQSSVRNDVTMRIVRQQDKVKELTRYCNFLEAQLMALSISLRQAEEKVRQTAEMGQTLNNFALTNSKYFKGNTKDEICRVAEQLTYLGQRKSGCACKTAAVNKLVNHLTVAANQRQTLIDCKPPADVIDAMSKLERLIGSDWHRLGRMLGLNPDCLDDIGKFTNFDLTSRAEKVITTWARQTRGANTEGLKQGLDKMDRDILLITEQPMCKDWLQLPPEVHTYVIAHVINVLSIVSQLSSQGILSQDSRAFILDAAQEHRRAGRMLQSIVYMGPPALCELCIALDSHNQSLVANKIRGSFSSSMLNNSPVSTSQVSDSSHKSALSIDILHSCVAQSSSKSSSKSSNSSKSGEKPRKKRSRSLFSRKNKLRDNEVESESAVDAQDEYNYYYPAANLNAVSVSDARENHAKLDDLPPPGPSRRHYERQVRSNHVAKSSKEVIV